MKTVGLITEYNPFHNGHKYHIEKAKELTGADYVVVVMSGNFVQRGAPAMADKYTRAQMALSMGADIVFELPVSFACASAEFFAYGAVSVLNQLGFIDSLCFGSETGSLSLLEPIAEILLKEPDSYKEQLNFYLKSGNSFPLGRAMALKDYIRSSACASSLDGTEDVLSPLKTISDKELASILLSPNNILGIEYLKALKQSKSRIVPYTLKREGSAYLEPKLAPECSFSSATAIRNILETGTDFDSLQGCVPEEVLSALKSLYRKTIPICENDFSDMLYYKLKTSSVSELCLYGDVSRELAFRIKKLLPFYSGYENFAMELKTKQVTLTRVKRSLLHIMLKLPNPEKRLFFIRLLGFRREASHLLNLVPASSVPVITKPAHKDRYLFGPALEAFEQEMLCNDLYNQVVFSKFGTKIPSDYTHPLIIL